jgi:hypothetical protein
MAVQQPCWDATALGTQYSPAQDMKEATSMVHAGGLQTHEDEQGELGFFWATKIGGPSHGFDFEGQCLLPLLANARNKALLISDPSWPAYPVGRAHLRLLWTPQEASRAPEPRLWLEAVNCDFDAAAVVDQAALTLAALSHAIEKAESMGVPLSVDPELAQDLTALANQRTGRRASVRLTCECIALRPSNGVCEASDFLSHRHDWVQLQEEVTEPLSRALYTPTSCKARRIEKILTKVRLDGCL